MRKPRALHTLVALGLAATFASCGGGEGPPSGSTSAGSPAAGGLGGASAGSDGHGAAPGLGGTGGAASGGSSDGGVGSPGGQPSAGGALAAGPGGSGGGAAGGGGASDGGNAAGGTPSGGAAVVYPPGVWAAIPGVPSACSVEKLQNADAFAPSYTWRACDFDLPGCEMLVLPPAFVLPKQTFASPEVRRDSSGFTLRFVSPNDAKAGRIAFLSRYDGPLLDAFRWGVGPDGLTSCGTSTIAIQNDRRAVTLFFTPTGVSTVLADAMPTSASSLGTLLPDGMSPFYEPSDSSIVGGRIVWRWGAGGQMTSIDAITGGDEKTLATDADFVFIESMTATPDYSVFGVSGATTPLYATDGQKKPFAFVGTPGASTGLARWADGWLFWFAGYDASQDGSTFSKLEIWATPYDKDPAKLKPAKVRDYPGTNVQDAVPGAGSGTLGFYTGNLDTGGPSTLHTVRADSGEHRSVVLPAAQTIWQVAGFTDSHVVFTVGDGPLRPGRICRMPLAGMPVSDFP